MLLTHRLRLQILLTRCVAVLTCLGIVAAALVITPVESARAGNAVTQGQKQRSNDKARKVKPPLPEKGKPKIALPNLDEIRQHRESHFEIKPAIPSSGRSKRKPLQKWDGRKVGDPGTGGSRSEIRGQRSTNDLRGFHHATKSSARKRKSAAIAPFLPDDAFVSNFLVNALGSGDHSAEQNYWNDIFRSAYYQGPEALLIVGREMGRTIFESASYRNRGRSNHEYVYDLYETYLMHAPDQGGWDFWTTTCDNYGREAVRAAFDQCGDFYNLITAVTPNGPISGNVGSISTARINPFNQAGDQMQARDAEWSLPIVSLPGRAGLDLGLSLSYSSLVWMKSGPYLYFDEDVSQISPGFHLGFAAIQGPFFDPLSSDQYAGRKVFVLVTSAGRRVELRQVNSTVYESSDSSYLQLTDNQNNTLTLRTTDGTQISYSPYANDWQATQIKDRNGNYISIGNDWRGDINTITDTLGRVIYFNNDSNGNLSSITQYWNSGWHTWANFSWGAALSIDASSLSGVVGTYTGEQIPVLRGVGLADGSSYGFDYRGNGQVSVIRRYSNDSVQRSYIAYDYENPSDDCSRIYQARLWADAWIGSEVVTQFNLPGDGSHQMVTPDQTVYREYYGSGWQNGLVTDARVYASGLQRQTTTAYTQDNTAVNYQTNPRVAETNIYDGSGNRRRTTIEYHSSFGLPHYIVEYAADGYNFLRRTHLEYKFDSQYIDRRIIGLPYQREVYDNNWTMMERTQYSYDWGGEFMQDLPAAPTQHDGGYHTGFVSGRGNLSAVDQYDVTDAYNTSKIHEAQTGYDVAGNVRFTRDAAGHTVSVSYGDWFSDGGNGRNTFSYPTTLTDADGYSSSVQYNYDFGARTYTQSPAPAGQPYGAMRYFYYDGAARLYDTYNANSGARTYFAYGPNYSQTWASVNSVYDNYSFRYFDGLGRETVSSNYHPSTGTYGTQLTYYDVMGRVSQQSNPTEMYGNWSPSADEAGGWIFSYQTYDWKGRPLVTTNQDGTQKYANYSVCGCAGNDIATITDELGRQQKSYSDVLGRTWKTEILNWNGSSYSTSTNTFNARDQITSIRQTDSSTGAYQDTSMVYDGYGRLYSKHLPEQTSGSSTIFTYKVDDVLESSTDARGAITTYTYSNNRHLVNSISYSAPGSIQASPTASFAYDSAGNRTWMGDGLGSVSYTFDSLSRLTSESRTINGVGTYALGYQYNLANQPTSISDPFGATASYGYDSNGRVNSVSGTGYSSVSQFASSMTYRAWGGLKSTVYDSTRSLSIGYNSKMNPTSFRVVGQYYAVGSEYDYYADGRISSSHDLTESKFDRSYTYDQAARVITGFSGSEAHGINVSDGPYRQTYDYDAWDNLTQRTGRDWTHNATPVSYTYDSSTNRNPQWQYDSQGNVTGEGSFNYGYDAAGRQVGTSQGGSSVSRDFDGDGLKIRYTSAVETNYFLRSTVLGGVVVAELNGQGQPYRRNVYSNGQLLAVQDDLYHQVSWTHRSPNNNTEFGSYSGSIGGSRAHEYDPLGTELGLDDPYQNGGSGNYGSWGSGNGDPSDLSTGCSWEGMAIGCQFAIKFTSWRGYATSGLKITTRTIPGVGIETGQLTHVKSRVIGAEDESWSEGDVIEYRNLVSTPESYDTTIVRRNHVGVKKIPFNMDIAKAALEECAGLFNLKLTGLDPARKGHNGSMDFESTDGAQYYGSAQVHVVTDVKAYNATQLTARVAAVYTNWTPASPHEAVGVAIPFKVDGKESGYSPYRNFVSRDFPKWPSWPRALARQIGADPFFEAQVHETGNSLSKITGTDFSSGNPVDSVFDTDAGQGFERCFFDSYRNKIRGK